MAKNKRLLASPWGTVIGAGFGGALIVALIALAFLWPSKTAQPRQLPIAIMGNSPAQLAAVEHGITASSGNRIKLVPVTSRAQAVSEIKHRDVYGALLITMPHPEVLTASANGAAANAVISAIGANLQTAISKLMTTVPPKPEPPVAVKFTDVVPTYNPSFDLALLAFPLVFGGTIGGAVISSLIAGRRQRLATLVIYALVAGNLMYWLLQGWFNVLPPDYWQIVGAFTLGVFATSSFVVGSYVLGGAPGLGIAAVFTLLVANPISGIALPAAFLPHPWGTIGQYLTVGASGALLRGVVYFHYAQVIAAPLIALCLWAVAGATAVLARERAALRSG